MLDLTTIAHVVDRSPEHLLVEPSLASLRVPVVDHGVVLVRDGLAHALVAIFCASLAWLSTLTVVLALANGRIELLVGLQEFPIVHHLAFELHHHGHSLLIDVLHKVGQRVLELVNLRRQHQVTLVKLDF